MKKDSALSTPPFIALFPALLSKVEISHVMTALVDTGNYKAIHLRMMQYTLHHPIVGSNTLDGEVLGGKGRNGQEPRYQKEFVMFFMYK